MKKLICCLFFFSTITAYQYKLSICAVTQDEGRWLKEWIEYHLLVGVEHFWIYDNNSKDNSVEILKPYVEKGIVELFDWPFPTHNHKTYLDMQYGAYNDVLKYAKGRTEWLALADIDELIVPIQEKTIPETLDKHFFHCAGVNINWQLYGTSHVKKIQPDELMVEKLTFRAPAKYSRHINMKCIVKPDLVSFCDDPHHYHFIQKDYYGVDTHGNPTNYYKIPIYTDVLVINHYWFKDEEFLHNVKIPRYVIWTGNGLQLLQLSDQLNEVEDRIMERFIPELRARVFGK